MGLRFKTRLTLTTSLLTIATIGVMALFVVWITVSGVFEQHHLARLRMTRVATDTVQYGISLQDGAMKRLSDQMRLTTMLLAELSDLAESDAEGFSEELTERLDRALSRATRPGEPQPLSDLLVTDAEGRVVFGLGEQEDALSASELAAVLRALEGQAGDDPQVRELRTGDGDGRPRLYGFVRNPETGRIVLVGSGEELLRTIRREYSPQSIVDKFRTLLDLTLVVIVGDDGSIVAEGHTPDAALAPGHLDEVRQFCLTFLRDGDDPYRVASLSGGEGAVTRLFAPDSGRPAALYLQFSDATAGNLVDRLVQGFAVVSVLMIAAAIVLSIVLGRSMSRPLVVLEDGVRRFGEGDLHRRVALDTADEFQGLADSFNQMADSIHRYMHELESETRRRERLESEMQIAAELQQMLLPETAPELPGVKVLGWSRSAREVGGDFYDFIPMSDGRLGVVIGDATGKGLSAALLTTECWSAFKALAESIDSPAELLRRTNNAMCRQTGATGRFVTLFYMVLDAENRTLVYSVAGHNPPFLVSGNGGGLRDLTSAYGLPLGIDFDCAFDEQRVELAPGDTLILYSDGITEARHETRGLYGERHFRERVQAMRALPIEGLSDCIMADIETHLEGGELSDDMTLVAVRCEPSISAVGAAPFVHEEGETG